MDTIAYELREAYAGTVTHEDGSEVPVFTGGLIRVGDGELDVAAALEEGAGLIVVDVDRVDAVTALDEYPALKRTKAPADAEPVVSVADGYADRKVGELRADAGARGFEGASSANKADLVLALSEHDRRLAEGGLDELGTPLTVEGLAAAATPDEA